MPRPAVEAALLLLLPAGTANAAWPDPPTEATWRVLVDGPVRVECATADGRPWCRSTALLAAPLAALRPVVDDIDGYPHLFRHIREVRPVDDDVRYVYVDYPAPLDDRDYLARFTRAEGAGWVRFAWQAVERADVPPVAGVVRLPKAAGSWELREVTGGTRVVYTWEAGIEGDVKDWVIARVRGFIGEEVLGSLAAAAGTTIVPAS